MSETRLSEEQKSEIRAKLGHDQRLCELLCNSTQEDLADLGEMLSIRKLMNNQYFPSDNEVKTACIVHDLYLDFGEFYTTAMIYNYGKIQGIRSERARRNRRANS